MSSPTKGKSRRLAIDVERMAEELAPLYGQVEVTATIETIVRLFYTQNNGQTVACSAPPPSPLVSVKAVAEPSPESLDQSFLDEMSGLEQLESIANP